MISTPSDNANVYCVMATVVNERTNVRLSVPLVNAIDGFVPVMGTMLHRLRYAPDPLLDNYSKFQNFFEVVPNEAREVNARLTCDDFAIAAVEADDTSLLSAADPRQARRRMFQRLSRFRLGAGTR